MNSCEIHGILFKAYQKSYDAYYCRACDKWLESPCDDPDCACAYRPEKPSLIKGKVMDKKIMSAKKQMDKKMNSLLKEDKKLDKKRDHCEEEVKMLKRKK